jgi:dolichol-phosphate mannosyltransferase
MTYISQAPSDGELSLLSIVIPARNEVESLPSTLAALYSALHANSVPHEIVVVDDGSTDGTWDLLDGLKSEIPTLRPLKNNGQNGFGRAIIHGLDNSCGDGVVIMMADASDSPNDAVEYWRILNEGYDCAFGSRFVRGGRTFDYPQVKLIINRVANFLVRVGFNIPLNDTTNAFKAYRRNVIDGCRPLLSHHFNLTVELPLKAIVRGYSYKIVPITWSNRRFGTPKLKIKEMGSRYFFICAYVWLEKYFSRGDYRRHPAVENASAIRRAP